MDRFVTAILFVMVIGCSEAERTSSVKSDAGVPPRATVTKKDDSTSCAYWKCSGTKQLYMQKYVKKDGDYRPAGAYKLNEGIGAFPLEELGKYGSDGENVSTKNGHDPCPYCRNTSLVKCSCDKTYCEKSDAESGTCPWCNKTGKYRSGSWGVGGGG